MPGFELATSIAGLFFSALLSATILPGSSEALLLYLASLDQYPTTLLWLAATSGNTLGGASSWVLGWLIAKYFPNHKATAEKKHHKAIQRLQHWGSPILLLSWVPVIGDPLCLAAGWLRINLAASILFISIGKGLRYAILLWIINN